MSLDQLGLVVQLGMLYAIPALAIVFAFRIIGFPDLTPDGSFTFGAAVCAVLLMSGWNQILAILVATIAGMVAGMLTALLHTRLHLSKLLGGILVMTMLYSVSLRVMNTSNLSLRKFSTFIGELSNNTYSLNTNVTIVILAACVFVILWVLLRTRLGFCLRAVGDSDSALAQKGVKSEGLYILGLAVVNGLAAFSGGVIAQYQGFVDITMGTGLVIICLAAVIIGETIIRPERISTLLLAALVGMIIYQGVITIALRMNLPAADLKIATALLALIFVASDRLRYQAGMVRRQIGNRNI